MLANIALPAFLPHSIATLLGIFVIAAVEGWFLMRGLELRYAESYRHALSANWMSTIAGIPLAWLLWVAGLIPVAAGWSAIGIDTHPVVQATLLQTVLTGGTLPTEWTDVGSAAAWLLLLIPCWMGSVWIEGRTIQRAMPDQDRARISSAVVRGNLTSYSVFLVLGVLGLADALRELPHQRAYYQESRERRERAAPLQGDRDARGPEAIRPESGGS